MTNNFLQQAVPHIDKNYDTLSEASESTHDCPSNWETREELKELVQKLGLKEVADLHQDRFKVDRRNLEEMITGHNNSFVPADVFFAKLMEETNTYITWPNKLKLGAKSKKDPHVRIAGRQEDVNTAKYRIMSLLNTKCNRVTMKMDVSYTDHSHIIGKGGLSIKRVMDETQCHVHFPDSNRSNLTEKSNQVSISGNLYGVEKARSRVRELIPLIFGFELPMKTQHVDVTSPYICMIQEQYNVQVMFKTRPKLHATSVFVKGVEWEVDRVKQATKLLMEYLCDSWVNQTPVKMSMEISPHQHQMVVGNSYSNLQTIMEYTRCEIIIPSPQDPNIPNLKKSNVSISGTINNVYKARQLLMGSLPLVIIFDLPEECTMLRTRPDQLNETQNNYNVSITIRQKAKQNGRSCVIKGVEKHAENIYKARSYILGLEEASVRADIPPSYFLPLSLPTSQSPQNLSNNISTKDNRALLSPIWHNQTTAVMQNQTVMKPSISLNCQTFGSSGYQSMSQCQTTNNSTKLEQSCEADSLSNNSSNLTISSVSSPRQNTSSYNKDGPILFDFPPGYHGTEVSRPQVMENKTLAGFKAMQNKATGGTVRKPTSSWSGYYVSHTNPSLFADIVRQKKQEDVRRTTTNMNDIYKPVTSLNTSNTLDQTSNDILYNLVNAEWPDLPTLLTSVGLERFIHIFNSNEIDLPVFSTLTDMDLMEIGITSLGARRRILLVIAELRKRSNPFPLAPGSERSFLNPLW